MDIEKHISDLLFEHDCVIIPGFGGFVADYAPATIQEGKHLFSPPRKSIIFNTQLKHNDGLLVTQISQAEGKTFSEANRILKAFVAICLQNLKEKKNIHLKNIGELSLNRERKIHFEADQSVNYLLDAFGLSSFQSPPIVREKYADRLEKTFTDRPAIRTRERSKTYRHIAIGAAIPIILLLLWIPFRTDLSKVNYININPFANHITPNYSQRSISFPELDEKRFSFDEPSFNENSSESIIYISLSDEVEGKLPVRMFEEAVADKTEVMTNVDVDKREKRFHIIAGCFGVKANAEKLVKNLRNQHFDAAIIGTNPKGLYIVSTGGFTSRKEAVKQLRQFQQIHNAKAWLLKR